MNRGALMQIEYNFRGKIQNLKLQIYKIPKKKKKQTNKQTSWQITLKSKQIG